ncbi:outer membrane beta-barrel protein [Flavobacterium sp. HJJ]|uniref:outer membrane beta-barrel protein n=1 Tax=Flavobacterium sp. HJJ TaxID=2783792 RepID=UPI00188A6AAE|nr:outer membrane beta-barrel protein [Flavobacterium sp. HJJ]MBF4471278.1 outer membrane beta-barrel protein [Flavobacterium sp. HJJ]
MKYSILLILFCLKISYGQEKKTKALVNFKPEFSQYAIIPFNFGDNYLAKANKSNVGLGTNFSFLQVQHFKLGMGYDYIFYSITDLSKAGNVGSSRYNSFYGTLAYEIKLSNELYLQPYLGLGSINLNFKNGNRSFGHQTGTDFRIGFNFDYRLNKIISAFTGIGYVSSKYDINTAPEFVSFYDNSKMLQINIGIKLKFINN